MRSTVDEVEIDIEQLRERVHQAIGYANDAVLRARSFQKRMKRLLDDNDKLKAEFQSQGTAMFDWRY